MGRGDFDQRVCEGARFTDIDKAKVKWFLQVARERRNFPLNPEASVKDLLAHLNLLCDGNLTNAAVLLFGKNPHKFFLQAEVKCIQFPSTEIEKPFTSYHIHSGKLVREKKNIGISDLQEIYDEITRKTLYRDLQSLVDKGILKAHGDKKGRKYSF